MEIEPTQTKPSDSGLIVDASAEKSENDYYFNSYSHFGIHEEMLKDEVRTGKYQAAILHNAALFKDKVVLDVGCGTGILSMFCAQAGAKKVIGVDCSGIIKQAREIVEANGFSDVITLIQGKVEEINLPEGIDGVDIIISEWMGYFLIYENMLTTVLVARDRWLKPGGLIFPNRATLYLCGIEDAEYKESKINWWDNVYGFDMSCIKKIAMQEPLVDIVDGGCVITDSYPVLTLDVMKMQPTDTTFTSNFRLNARRSDAIHAFVAYFDIHFTLGDAPVSFSTGPGNPYTHWKQTVFYTDHVIAINRGEVLEGSISCSNGKVNPREVDIVMKYAFSGASTNFQRNEHTQLYFLR
ncbi:arginine nmethyltransferase, putative [Acanthamoeba castellanii str. Neff]|jgi:protein arginine N-methyltransferase 1|uniref:type I protein arginine methyltransferase n=2 Tax=Acanthamoeba castellanii TaxID=5755 RepID=L8H8R1_ACACF|nr:arginine nmethyltransferase, putative [Acanthamoeba castellanii str. Neff]ALV66538.1 arginine methyltransferase 1 [Acanthamoeba castellanii]ELR21103.1 arginine nmethyltransferase, putative [Acanthamoeba castellanii str. Neff]